MPMPGLLEPLRTDPAVQAALRAARDRSRPRLDLTTVAGQRAPLLASVAGAGSLVLAVTATGREAEDLAAALRSLLGEEAVAEFPSWETLPHERLSPRSDTVGRRLAVLRRLAHPEDGSPVQVVVAPIRSVLQPQVAGLGDLEPVRVTAGQELELEEVTRRLADAAYLRTDLVEKRGDFAVRGGILDVFPPTEEHPLRLEFWGDTVEEIRYFKVADQRSLEVAQQGLWAPPCRELLLTETVRKRAHGYASEYPELADVFGKVAEGIAVEGMESLAPVLVDRMELLVDVLPAGARLVVCDPERVRTRAADLVRTSQEFLEASWAAAAMGGKSPLDLGAASLWSLADLRDHARSLNLPWWSVTPFAADTELAELMAAEPGAGEPDDGAAAVEADDTVVSPALEAPEYRGEGPRLIEDVRAWLREGWRVVLTTEGHGPAERTAELLRAADLG